MGIAIESKSIEMVEIKSIITSKPYYINQSGDVFNSNFAKLKPRPGGYKKKYKRVSLSTPENRKGVDRYVHRLVLEAFVGICPGGMQCAHNDGDPSNNNLSNLRWDTPLNNSRDKIVHGTSGVGEKNSMAKMSNSTASWIVNNYKNFKALEIAERFNIASGTVSGIAVGSIRYIDENDLVYLENKKISQDRIKEARDASNKKRRDNSRKCK